MKTTHKDNTELYIGENILKGPLLTDLCKKIGGRPIIVADRAVKDLHPLLLEADRITLSDNAKNKTTQEYLENALFKLGAGKDTILIAMGGGVTTDLVGFVASIYLRGVSLILIPTTLLAIVDASIGGKTAIDTPFGKNLIGTFYPAHAIIVDLDTLKTLPEKEWLNGLAEILKIGLVLDLSIWEMANKKPKDKKLIQKAIDGKRSVVNQDPKELGLRRILNFGHTIGHALEAISHYKLSHGEAIAIGSIVEAHLSMHLGYLSEKDFQEIQSSYTAFPLQLPKNYNRDAFLNALSHDKKRIGVQMRCVLIDAIGHALPFNGDYCRPISAKELEITLDWMEKKYGRSSDYPL